MNLLDNNIYLKLSEEPIFKFLLKSDQIYNAQNHKIPFHLNNPLNPKV